MGRPRWALNSALHITLLAALLTSCPELCAAGAVAGEAHVGRGRISPTLEPESHNEFFDHDYPDDITPHGARLPSHHGFDHPYPKVQDTDDYDKDYVKDENGDNGEWAAQEEYDRLRTKLAQYKAEAANAKEAKEALERELAAQQAEHERHLKELEEMRKAQEDARKAAEEAEAAQFKKAEAGIHHAGEGIDTSEGDRLAEEVVNATSQVEKENQDIDDCKEELAKAQAELKRLQEERVKAEQAQKEAAAAKAAAAEKEFARELAESQAEAELGKKEKVHADTLANYNAEKAKLDKMESDYKAAEITLRRFRNKGVDQNAGVTRSGGTAPSRTWVLGVALAVAIATCIAV